MRIRNGPLLRTGHSCGNQLTGVARLIADAQAPTTLCTTAREHLTSVLGGHPLAESVRITTLAAAGLISSLHCSICLPDKMRCLGEQQRYEQSRNSPPKTRFILLRREKSFVEPWNCCDWFSARCNFVTEASATTSPPEGGSLSLTVFSRNEELSHSFFTLFLALLPALCYSPVWAPFSLEIPLSPHPSGSTSENPTRVERCT